MLVARAVGAVLAGALLASGLFGYLAAHQYGRAQQWLAIKGYGPALNLALRASEYALAYDIRLNLPLTADQGMQAAGRPLPIMDEVYRIGRTASPYHPNLRLARLRYLRLADKNPDEQQALIAALRREQPYASARLLHRMGIQ